MRHFDGEDLSKLNLLQFVRKFEQVGAQNFHSHLVPQSDVIEDECNYNCAFSVNNLYENMILILGKQNAKQFFFKPRNSGPKKTNAHCFDENTPLLELKNFYHTHGFVPNLNSCDAAFEAKAIISNIYEKDFKMIKAFV